MRCQLLPTFGNYWQLLSISRNVWQLLLAFANFVNICQKIQQLGTFVNLYQLLATFSNIGQHLPMFTSSYQMFTTFANLCQQWFCPLVIPGLLSSNFFCHLVSLAACQFACLWDSLLVSFSACSPYFLNTTLPWVKKIDLIPDRHI